MIEEPPAPQSTRRRGSSGQLPRHSDGRSPFPDDGLYLAAAGTAGLRVDRPEALPTQQVDRSLYQEGLPLDPPGKRRGLEAPAEGTETELDQPGENLARKRFR